MIDLSPQKIAKVTADYAVKKIKRPLSKIIVSAVLAGVFVAFAAEAYSMSVHNLNYGFAKTMSAIIFTTGLIFVIVTGADLFTSNNLIIVGVLEKRLSFFTYVKNLIIVYSSNFVGAMLIVFLVLGAGILNTNHEELGGYAIFTAVKKIEYSFLNAVCLGLLCNWIVCLAVWMSYATHDIGEKILILVFPVWLFVIAGFEHSVANMYYIPTAIFAKNNPVWVEKAIEQGVSLERIQNLNWSNFLSKNLLPVTIGNILGGSVCVGVAFWFIYLNKKKK